MKSYSIYLILVIALLCLCIFGGCKKGNRDRDYIYIVKNWTGKEMCIPEGYNYQIKGDVINYDIDDADFKIVTYVDSTGCHTCNMQLNKWDEALSRLKSIPDVSVNFVMVLESPDKREIQRILETEDFLHPVAFDYDNLFAHSNVLPADESCHTFLLDADNRILAIGNPALNPKTLELYIKVITENRSIRVADVCDSSLSLCEFNAKTFGLISVGDTAIVSYELYNNLGKTIHVQDVVPSCGCIKVTLLPDSICNGEYALIETVVSPTERASDYRQSVNIYYKEVDNPELVYMYGFVQ